MPYDFSELINQYCTAKADAANNVGEQRFRGRLEKSSRQLVNAILKHGNLYPLNNEVYRQEYQELLSVVLEEILATVCQEYDRRQGSLTTWINKIKRFQYRVIDLFPKTKNSKQWGIKKRMQNLLNNPLSLNKILIRNEDQGIEAIELLISKNLEGLDLMIEQERLENLKTLEEVKTVNQAEIAISLNDLNGVIIEDQEDYRKKNTNNSQHSWSDLWINYLENDPDNFFKNKIYRDRDGQLRPECNDHVLLQRILLNDFREGTIITQAHYKTWYNKLKLLENEFNVSVDTLYSNLRHSKRPHTIINYCLGFAVTFGFNNDALKENIEYDGDRFLRNNYLRNYELCNSQWLAQHRLPCFVEVPKDFNDLITLLAAKEKRYSKLKPYQIENHWFKHTLPRLGQLASRLIYNL